MAPISGSNPGLLAIAGGYRSTMDARQLRTLLDAAGALDPSLARAIDGVEVQGQAIVEAGAKLASDGVRGSLLDLLA